MKLEIKLHLKLCLVYLINIMLLDVTQYLRLYYLYKIRNSLKNELNKIFKQHKKVVLKYIILMIKN